MNRWKTKKKSKDAESGARGPSSDSDHPPMPILKTSKSFMFGRKTQEPEPKPQIDLENALPSTDDFRTSLLMSGLSARFSMLREQDDPKSKIGKASDDSVLFPKRQSRLNDFGFQSHGLSDIAEVSSIHGSVRPPFAFGRTDSYHEGYGTDDEPGSIMDRKKPTEGNNLFGGRQKIYKIPTSGAGSIKSVEGTGSGGMSGRALYDDDVSQSAFQKLRERERQQQQQQQQQQRENWDDAQQGDEFPSRSNSPTGYNRNRETSSTTTTSSLTRSSTAATSVTSQRTPSLNGNHTTSPVIAKTRRLYEHGLDQQLHEQQHSAMSRLDSLSRQRNLGAHTPPPGITSPIMSSSSGDKWDRHPMAGKQSMPNLRAANPTPAITPIGTFDFGIKANPSPNAKSFGVTSPPLSPPMSESGDVPVLPVQPNDVGKATALGAFSKPAQAYDETKYSQKQIQMQQGRETPTFRKQSPPRGLVGRPLQQQPQMPRNRADSTATFASGRSRSNSSAQGSLYSHDRIPESTFLSHQESVPEDSVIPTSTFTDRSLTSTPSPTDGHSEQARGLGPEEISRLRQATGVSLERPPESHHPANRQDPFAPSSANINTSKPVDLGIITKTTPEPTSFRRDNLNLSPAALAPPADSPTLGPTSGLSNIRQHLRTDSNTSSVYSAIPSAGLTSRFPDHPEPTPQIDYAVRANPWEDNEWDQGYDADDGRREPRRSPPKATESSALPLANRSNVIDDTIAEDATPSWEQEIDAHHNRAGSTATQKEQQEFQNELATRRRQIKENLKSFVETESRSGSPTPGQDRDYNSMKHPALGLLKTKTSRGSLVGKPIQPSQSKAMKMLGLNGSNSPSNVSPVRHPYDDNMWKHEEEEMLRGIPKPPGTPPQMKAFRQARREAQRDRERQVAQRHQPGPQRMPNEGFRPQANGEPVMQHRGPGNGPWPPNIRTGPRDPSRDRKPPPVAYTQREEAPQESGSRAPSRASRDRSSSDASLRSKSRNGRYKDDLAKAMAEGISSSNQGYDELAVPVNRFGPKSPGTPNSFNPSPVPSPMIGTPRSRSNSAMTPNGYFEQPQKFPTLQPSKEFDYAPPRPSPGFSVNSTPSLAQPSPVPSMATTPTNQAFQSQGQTKVPAAAARKRSINKADISEPKLISSTSRITTVDLPPGSSLQNGMEPYSVPPIPPVNPRRRQTRTMFGFSKKEDLDDSFHSLPQATQSTDEMSTFSADEGEKPRMRQKLRKSSSEGGNLNARARQAAFAAPSPALPASPLPPPMVNNGNSPPRPNVEGGMF